MEGDGDENFDGMGKPAFDDGVALENAMWVRYLLS
jgi:hypothetical protein